MCPSDEEERKIESVCVVVGSSAVVLLPKDCGSDEVTAVDSGEDSSAPSSCCCCCKLGSVTNSDAGNEIFILQKRAKVWPNLVRKLYNPL